MHFNIEEDSPMFESSPDTDQLDSVCLFSLDSLTVATPLFIGLVTYSISFCTGNNIWNVFRKPFFDKIRKIINTVFHLTVTVFQNLSIKLFVSNIHSEKLTNYAGG